MDLSVDWLSIDPKACLVHGWDDGHLPETFRTPPADDSTAEVPVPPDQQEEADAQAGSSESSEEISGNRSFVNETAKDATVERSHTARTLLVWRPHTWHSPASSSEEVAAQIVDDALPSALVEAIYRVTVRQGEPSWGTYVAIEDIVNNDLSRVDRKVDFDNDTEHQSSIDQLAALACSAYFRHTLKKDGGLLRQLLQQKRFDDAYRHEPDPGDNEADITSTLTRELHGVAVWALSSTAHSSVTYHVDYAEQVRYRHNVVVLPHLAGTLHCSPVNEMVGGDLVVYKDFQHYERHGYKACKEAIPPPSEDSSVAHIIPYRFNRMVIMAGHLPHSSTPVEAILPQGCRRVIVGFNVFGHDIGGIVQAAPEHSATWKRQVKLLRLQQRQENRRIPVSIGSISQLTPAVRKLLVLAKRRKVQDEWRLEYLSNRLREVLHDCESNTTAVTEPELIRRIVSHSTSSSPCWLTQQDVQLFLRDHYFPKHHR